MSREASSCGMTGTLKLAGLQAIDVLFLFIMGTGEAKKALLPRRQPLSQRDTVMSDGVLPRSHVFSTFGSPCILMKCLLVCIH